MQPQKLSVLIADDEKLVCVLLRDLIKWDDLNLVFAGEVYNGKDAFEFICNNNPDIVLTDIRMPVMDGLEVVRKCQEKDMETEFIIISGHKDFEYARTAIQCGVNFFLLKPINDIEINEALLNLKTRILERKGIIEAHSAAMMEMDKTRQKIRNRFISDFYEKPDQISRLSIESVNGEYALQFHNGVHCFRCIIVQIDSKLSNITRHIQDIQKQTEQTFESILADVCIESVICIHHNQIIALAQYENEDAFLGVINDAHEKLVHKFYVNAHVTVGISGEYPQLDPLLIKGAVKAVVERADTGVDRVIMPSAKSDGFDLLLNKESFWDLTNSLETVNIEKISDFFERHQAVLTGEDAWPVYNTYLSMIDQVDSIMRATYNSAQLPFESVGLFDKLVLCKTKEEMFQTVKDLVVSLVTKYRDSIDTRENYYIRQAKKYVSEHFAENILLEDISAHLYINATYFSTLFKKQEGENFSHYVMNYRLKIAKELLKQNDLSISSIAEKTGYKSQKYFSKLFMKSTGLTPSEYRKLYC